MFSGIVREIGILKSREFQNGILNIIIESKKLISELEIGDSVAVNGSCLTVIEKTSNSFKVQATEETLVKTNFEKLTAGSKLNLELALKVGDKLDGHLVLGHVDACGEISDILSVQENKIIRVSIPKGLELYIAPKGSISVNGVSLTVIDSKNSEFGFTLIPYTRDNTNLGLVKIGDLVNLEIDLVSRYLVNYIENTKALIVK